MEGGRMKKAFFWVIDPGEDRKESATSFVKQIF